MAPHDGLNKDDLYLLLESYKNCVEMNTVILQQLSSLGDIMKECKDNNVVLESNLKERIDSGIAICENIKEKLIIHDKDSGKGYGKLANRVNLLYVAVGSIVLSLIVLVVQIIEKYDILKHIAAKLSV